MIEHKRLRSLIAACNFDKLFIEELGWDRHRISHRITVDESTFQIDGVAQKRGVQILRVLPHADGQIPDSTLRGKIERRVTEFAREHLLIFTDAKEANQHWQWVAREPGKPAMVRPFTFDKKQPSELLVQALQKIVFTLDEEEGIDLLGATLKLKDAFNRDKVTGDFYKEFKKERDAFGAFLRGIPDDKMQRWYVSVMLNRLMFLYFLQEKRFLDDQPRYLQEHLRASATRHGADRFYKDFLCPLFFDGLARRKNERSAETRALLGEVPYLNGGLFLKHQVEEHCGDKIEITDAAFAGLFTFFDKYRWHLDERPLRAQNEINPDVLGYIFEKYVNQKQMGAYYTKEDITEYIGRSTILPFLMERAGEHDPPAFQADSSLWALLRENPDAYLFDAVKKGADLPLPNDIAAGLDDVAKRGGWNRPAPAEYALPTEIWREVVARRKRCEGVRAKLANGEVTSVNDLITLNLDIRQFVQDALTFHERPDFVRAFWEGLTRVSVLDPTCGSGAFLFAALNILHPLYEACLARMQAFVEDWERLAESDATGRARRVDPFGPFRVILAEANDTARHPSRDYYIFKNIILRNLYGVDILEEAVEICKLRLFLKLAAQVEPDRSKENLGIEPLPDIDFNIRAGNTLVGFATEEQTRRAATSKLDFEGAWERIKREAEVTEGLFEQFRRSQTGGSDVESGYAALQKKALRTSLDKLRDELDRSLAHEYGKISDAQIAAWRESHQPFHWFVEFYGLVKQGGFDVIIGNPPYIEYSKIKKEYQVKGYKAESSGNLYAFVMEQCMTLLKPHGWQGMVIQQPIVSTQRMESLRKILLDQSPVVICSTYDDRPSKLFDGIHHSRIAIVLNQKGCSSDSHLYVTSYNKWYKEERPALFERLAYSRSEAHKALDVFPKIGSCVEAELINRLISVKSYFEQWICAQQTEHRVYYKITGVGHWFTNQWCASR